VSWVLFTSLEGDLTHPAHPPNESSSSLVTSAIIALHCYSLAAGKNRAPPWLLLAGLLRMQETVIFQYVSQYLKNFLKLMLAA